MAEFQIQNHFLMQHVAIILLSKITPCWIIIYKVSLFSTQKHGEIHSLKELELGGEGGGGRPVKKAAGFCQQALAYPCPGLQITGGREKGR